MAIQINESKKLSSGITLPSLYGRLKYDVNLQNDRIEANLFFYKDKIAFKENASSLQLDYARHFSIGYNYLTDGEIVDHLHKKVIEELMKEEKVENLKFYQEDVYQLDEDGGISTIEGMPVILHKKGDPMLDANGVHISEWIYMKQAFCLLKNITIVDL